MTHTRAGGFIERVRLDPHADTGRYPFTLPVVRQLARAGGLDLDPQVTFLVGDNGSGKSTLVEALAVAAGFNAEGGSQSFRFATRATESSPGEHLILRWNGKPKTGYPLADPARRARRPHPPDRLSRDIQQIGYDEAEPVALTRGFLADPGRFLRHLFNEEPS